MNRYFKIASFIPFISLLILCLEACSFEETPKTYSYNDLTPKQQVVIDEVLNEYDMWKSYHDTGKDFGCTNVTFLWEGEDLIFATCYRMSEGEEINGVKLSGPAGYKIFEVDETSGSLSGHSYDDVFEVGGSWKDAACISAYAGSSFQDSLSVEEKKDVLAHEYYMIVKD